MTRILTVTVMLLLSLALGLYRLRDFPVRYHPDEAMDTALLLDDAVKMSAGPIPWRQHPLLKFFFEYDQPDARPNPSTVLAAHATWLCLRFLPVDFVTLRASTVLTGTLGVLLLYLVLRLMFNNPVALLGSLFLATQPWQLAINRVHLPYAATQVYALFCVWLFWKAEKGSSIFYLLLGIALAVSNALYPTFWMVFILLGLYLFFRLLIERSNFKRRFAGILILALSFLLTLQYRGVTPKQFFAYSKDGSPTVFRGSESLTNTAEKTKVALVNFVRKIANPNQTTFRKAEYIERGVRFQPFMYALAALGLILCLIYIRQPEYSFLLLWLICSMLPNIVTGGGEVDRRAIMIIAPMMALAAIPLAETWRLFSKFIPKVARIAILAAIVGFSTYSGAATYFGPYIKDAEHLRDWGQFKEFDTFLAKILDNDYPVYFLNGDNRYYVPDHEAHYFTVLRLYAKSRGKIYKREYYADSIKKIDRADLILKSGGFVAVAGSANQYPDWPKEWELFDVLKKTHPGAKRFDYACPGVNNIKVSAVVVNKEAK